MGLRTRDEQQKAFIKITIPKGDEAPFFVKYGDGEGADQKMYNELEGELIDAKLDSYEREGKARDTFKLVFQDKDGEFVLSSAFTKIGRSIINSLASQETYGNIKIALYGKVNKNGKFIKGAWITNNDERCERKHSFESTQHLVEGIKNSKGEVLQYDYSGLDNLFMEEVKKMKEKLVAQSKEIKIIETKIENKQDIDENFPF